MADRADDGEPAREFERPSPPYRSGLVGRELLDGRGGRLAEDSMELRLSVGCGRGADGWKRKNVPSSQPRASPSARAELSGWGLPQDSRHDGAATEQLQSTTSGRSFVTCASRRGDQVRGNMRDVAAMASYRRLRRVFRGSKGAHLRPSAASGRSKCLESCFRTRNGPPTT